MHITEIYLTFPDEDAAIRGLELFRDMMKTAYADRKGMFPAEADQKGLVLCQKFFLYRDLVKDYDPIQDFPYTRIARLKREGNCVGLDQVADLQELTDDLIPTGKEFMIQLCEAAALDAPDSSFEAESVFEETISATRQILRAQYRDRKLHMRLSWLLDEDSDEPEPKETGIEDATWEVIES